MLTRENCFGVWVPTLSEWDPCNRFDDEMFAKNVQTLVSAGVHVIYTTGTDGEFYAMRSEEFQRMVDIVVACTRGTNTSNAIGTNGTNTHDILAQIEYCAKTGADAVMAAFPFWLEIGDREWLPFLQDSCQAAQSMGLLHYNTVRAKRVLHPADYAVCARQLPLNFIGSKSAMADFGLWCQLDFESPGLVHIPMETSAVPTLIAGGKGFIAAILGAMNPALARELYNLCAGGKWDDAMDLQLRLNRVEYFVCNQLLRRRGYRAGTISKALTRIGGRLLTHNSLRKPYEPVPEDLLDEARRLVATLMPELLPQ